MLASLNAERAAVGVAPLAACGSLNQAAQAHSADQAAHNKMSHTGSNGSTPWARMHQAGYYYNAAAENVAAGQRSVTSVMSAWMNSSGHRSNIRNSAYAHVGVGLAYSAGGTPYWTQKFGRGGAC
ncbi:MAG: CAP domain-containing protein [Microthrixaceae bacterium]